VLLDQEPIWTLGLGLVAMIFPFSMTFTNGSRSGSWLFGAVGALTLLGALLQLVAGYVPFIDREMAMSIFSAGAIGCVASTWLGNVPALRRPA
jgi:hypothetical protein